MPTALLEPPKAEAPADWWNPGVSLQQFHDSPARVRWLIGARGVGKTAATGMEAIRHGWHNAGGKAMFIRKTEISQSDTTIETIASLFDSLGDLYQDTGDGLFASWNEGRTIRIPSVKAVEAFNAAKPTWKSKADRMTWLDTEGNRLCSFIEFRGLPSAKISESKLRGFECSFMALVEADLLEEKDFQMAVPCIRWKGADPDACDANGFIIDSCIVVETNPPSPRHWIARTEEETIRGEHPDYQFWHIKTEENAHNLPPNYVANLKAVYRNNAAMYARMVNGEYAEAFDGSPVYYAFRPDDHVGEDLPWQRGAYLIRGWDFGTNNAVVWSAYWVKDSVEYWHDLAEQYMEGSDTDRQAREAIKKTENDFPFWNDRDICAGLLDYCDPAGVSSAFTRQISVNGKQVNESAVNILRTYGIAPGFQTTARGLQQTIAIYNRLLEKKDALGRYVYRVDKKHCPILHRALSGQYRYSREGEPGFGSNEPLKGTLCGNCDHIADSSRYPKINVLKLLKAEMEATKKPNYQRPRKNPNPTRQI